jgi:Secretion system C-terminal sorting domain/FG-GAP-like repeat
MKKLLPILIFIGAGLCSSYAQSITITNNTSEAIITKATANVPSIPTGEPFNYQITFQNLNQSNLLSITDVLPAGLCYSPSDIVADNTFLDFAGNQVPNPNAIPGLIDASSLPTVVFTIPNNVQRGSFTLTVRFCAGVTPDGFTVENNICAEYGPGGPGNESFCSTSGITSTASAVNPWGAISKEPLFPAIAGQNGDFFIPTSNGMANYKIRVSKSPGLESSVFGMLNLENPTISEVFPPCASISLLSGPGTLDPATNTITLTNDLQGNVPFEAAEFIVSVDFSGCPTYTDGDIITNTVSLNGTPVGKPFMSGIDTATAQVIAVDALPPPVGSSELVKSVSISNPVEGCLGVYTLQLINTDNRPISSIDITDVLPNDIIPQGLSISGNLNSASQTDTFDLIVNNGTPTSVSINLGYNQNPWTASNNDLRLTANPNTQLYPQDLLFITIPFLVNTPTPVGTPVVNCATLDAAIIDAPNNINLALNNTSCIHFNVQPEEIKLCVDKGVRKAYSNNAFVDAIINIVPTDELEFQICVQNNGSLDFTNGQLVDVLDSKYEFLTLVSDNFPAGTTFAQTGQTLTWSNINLSQQCATFDAIAGCTNPNNQVFCAVIRVRVAPLTPPGNIDNAATITGNGLSETSEFAKVNIKQASVLRIVNEVSQYQTNWVSSLTLDPVCETDVYHRVTLTNLGNQILQGHQIIDELPFAGDTYFPSTLSRNSTFSLETILNMNAPNYTVEYITTVPSSATPAPSFDCSTVPNGNANPTPSTKSIIFKSIGSIAPGATSTMEFESTIPGPTAVFTGDLARNSVYLVDCTGSNGGIIIPSNITEINIVSSAGGCTPLDLEPYQNAVPAILSQNTVNEIITSSLPGKDKEYGDFDNDGDMDILYTKDNITSSSPELHVLINSAGQGNQPIFNTPGINLGVDFCYSHRLFDWDNDGFNDVVVYGHNAGLYVFINDQNLGLNLAPITLLQGSVNFTYLDEVLIAVGDLSNDGLPDVLLSSQSAEIPGTVYFENQGANSLLLPAPQVWTTGVGITNPFIPEDGGSYPSPEIFDADCDGDLDVFISDPLIGPPFGGGRVLFYENNGAVTNGTLPDINPIGVPNVFGLDDDVDASSPLRCDWIITRFVDFQQTGCPIAIAYNPCNDNFYYYDRECASCDGTLSVNHAEIPYIEDEIILFPNPSNDKIFINGTHVDSFHYQIISVNGSILFENSGKAGEAIDVSILASGLYFIQIETEDSKTSVKRFIKQ